MFRKRRSARPQSGRYPFGPDMMTLPGTDRADQERISMNDAMKPHAAPARSLSEIPPVPAPGSQPRREPDPSFGARAADARMTVGPGIRLKGAIADCTHLVVEGTVEVTLTTDLLEVAEGGTFKGAATVANAEIQGRSEEHTSELQSLMRIPYAVF